MNLLETIRAEGENWTRRLPGHRGTRRLYRGGRSRNDRDGPVQTHAHILHQEDLPELLSFYRLPQHLGKKLRTTNIIERCFVEARRRTRRMVCFHQRAKRGWHHVLTPS